MQFSARAAGGDGRRNAHPRPSYGGLQEIVMLTLIEEPVGCRLLSLAIPPAGGMGSPCAELQRAIAYQQLELKPTRQNQ